MAFSYIDVGGKEANGVDIVTIAVDTAQSETVTVKNISGDTISYFSSPASVGTGTITSSNSQAFTTPVWIKSAGRSSISVTGGKY